MRIPYKRPKEGECFPVPLFSIWNRRTQWLSIGGVALTAVHLIWSHKMKVLHSLNLFIYFTNPEIFIIIYNLMCRVLNTICIITHIFFRSTLEKTALWVWATGSTFVVEGTHSQLLFLFFFFIITTHRQLLQPKPSWASYPYSYCKILFLKLGSRAPWGALGSPRGHWERNSWEGWRSVTNEGISLFYL